MHKRAEVGLQDIPKTRVGRNTGCHKNKSWYTGCPKPRVDVQDVQKTGFGKQNVQIQELVHRISQKKVGIRSV